MPDAASAPFDKTLFYSGAKPAKSFRNPRRPLLQDAVDHAAEAAANEQVGQVPVSDRPLPAVAICRTTYGSPTLSTQSPKSQHVAGSRRFGSRKPHLIGAKFSSLGYHAALQMRCTVPTPMPSSLAMLIMPLPFALKRSTFDSITVDRLNSS